MRRYQSLFVILIIAFTLRLGAIVPVHAQKYSSDEIEYIGIAKHLAQGGEFVDSNGDRSIRAPLFPIILSFFFRLFGGDLLLPQIFNCLISSLAVLLIYFISMRLWNNEKAACLASTIAALYPGLIICAGMLQTENLYIAFFLLAIFYANQLSAKPNYLNAIMIGAVSALASLTRAVFFGFFPILLFTVWFINRKNSVNTGKYIIISFAAWCLVLSPWAIRNYFLFDAIVPISSGGGNSLLTGNNPYATGTWRTEGGFDKWYEEQALEHEVKDLTKLNEVERSALSGKLAAEFIFAHPWKTIKLALKKAHIFWIYPATHTDSDTSVQILAVIIDFILLVGVLLGITAAPNLNRKILLIASPVLFFTLTQMVLHAEARFRLPLLPLLCLFFGWGSFAILNKEQRTFFFASKKKLVVSGLLTAVAVIVYAYTGILFLKGLV